MNITYTNSISIEDYTMLRGTTGWQEIETSQAEAGLKGSEFLTVAKDGENTVGMARFISDGGYIGFISDVIVLPEYQKLGIGKRLVGQVMDYASSRLKDGQSMMISLMAAKGKEPFYQKFGFESRPNEDFGCGMHCWLNK